MQTISTTEMTNVNHVPLPAFRNTSSGRSAMAALGAALATDCASTSGSVSVLRLSVFSPAIPVPGACDAPAAGSSDSPGFVVSATCLPTPPFSPGVLMPAVGGAVRMAVLGHRYVQGRVAVEEPDRLQVEADVMGRHDGPVLRPHDVVGAEHVPDDQVRVLQRPIGRRVRGQPVAAR